MHEREFMARWIKARLKTNKRDYWYRIPDAAEGTKPFDGILLTRVQVDRGFPFHTMPIAIEFKVWRKKRRFDYSTVEPHQLRELLAWKRAGGIAWIVVFFEHDENSGVFVPEQKDLRKALNR